MVVPVTRARHLVAVVLTTSAAAALLTGCRTEIDEYDVPAAEQQGVVLVEHPEETAEPALVYLSPEGGFPEMIGTVQPGAEGEFVVEPNLSLRYRLVAELGGREIASEAFTFSESTAVEWNLGTNELTVPPR